MTATTRRATRKSNRSSLTRFPPPPAVTDSENDPSISQGYRKTKRQNASLSTAVNYQANKKRAALSDVTNNVAVSRNAQSSKLVSIF